MLFFPPTLETHSKNNFFRKGMPYFRVGEVGVERNSKSDGLDAAHADDVI